MRSHIFYYFKNEESRLLIAGPSDCAVRFYLSELLRAFGLSVTPQGGAALYAAVPGTITEPLAAAGGAISGCRPGWLKEPRKRPVYKEL